MRSIAVVALMLLAVDAGRVAAPTNSHAATSRGAEAFAEGDYRAAERAFREAVGMRPVPATAFGLGTSQIAAGNTEEGARNLNDALNDPSLGADAYYNRGSSELRSKEFEAAVRDFEQALRLRPADPAAKRNLEIALKRREEQQQQQENQQGAQQQQQPQQSPGREGEQQEQQQQQGDAESLLRSVEQQEREELSRMRRSKRAEPRIGW